MNKVLRKKDTVTVRIDNAYVSNGKHLTEAYVREDNTKRFFGNFRFQNTKEAKKTLVQAVEMSGLTDNVFYGDYPSWEETEEYGEQLKVQNRVRFFPSLGSKKEIEGEEIYDYVYALELHLKERNDGGIFLVCPRAIAIGRNEKRYNDDLFEDGDTPIIDVQEDDLPF